ncbi:unnamed protein product [Paramecium primaurelia]|uniref:Uncharacterized protein n=1 Tax=Paramecium primaurelia TaxID=5886 RepID=A0A8S1KSW5_PARPR|nr:unnamed protein product [Paramecium primaurelia]
MNQEEKQNENKEPEVKDNVEEFGMKVLSAEEQKKIMLQISEEESFNLNNLQQREDDAVFIEDEPEKALAKLLSIHQQNFQERQAYARHLAELIIMIGNEAQQQLTQIINQLISDSDEIKKILIHQLNLLIDHIDVSIIKQHILPASMQLIKYHNFDIQSDVQKQISRIAQKLSNEDINELILNDLILMAHDESNEENKMVALQFFGSYAHIANQQFLESFISIEFINAGEDISVRVRKESLQQLPQIAKSVRPEFFVSKLLPYYLQKSEDKSSWHIRKACVEIIVKLAEIAPKQVKQNELSNKMVEFLKDSNKWVKASAFQLLGQFIHTLHDCNQKNEQLLNEYCRSLNKDVCEYFSSDQEIYDACAATFHYVVEIYGQEKWPNLLKLLQSLVKNKGVRKVLAENLYIIAKSCGPRYAEKDLVIILDSFLKDLNDEVKYAAAKNLWEFIKIFDEEKRDNLLDVVLIIQRDQKKWRIRHLIAKQIKHLVPLYSVDNIFQIIVPITLKLCNDIVAVVRKQAAKEMHSILLSLNTEDETSQIYYQCLIENIKAYGISHRFNQRQAFAYMCSKLITLKEFESTFLEQFVSLSLDPVKNVRITVALIVQKRFKQGHLKDNQKIQQMIQNLKTHKDREVLKILD